MHAIMAKTATDIVGELIQLGFVSIIVTINLNLGMRVEYLGRILQLILWMN